MSQSFKLERSISFFLGHKLVGQQESVVSHHVIKVSLANGKGEAPNRQGDRLMHFLLTPFCGKAAGWLATAAKGQKAAAATTPRTAPLLIWP